jgi:Holliday junction DNA helicase RuvA
VQEGLIGLGWSAKEADKAVEAVSPQATAQGSTGPAGTDVAALLRAALRTLSKA